MISRTDLRAIARALLRDAEALLAAKRYDGAFHICGYAVELALKARICRTFAQNNRNPRSRPVRRRLARRCAGHL
jgi:HEPN domain-containing protein